jgi:hypothetical protein
VVEAEDVLGVVACFHCSQPVIVHPVRGPNALLLHATQVIHVDRILEVGAHRLKTAASLGDIPVGISWILPLGHDKEVVLTISVGKSSGPRINPAGHSGHLL